MALVCREDLFLRPRIPLVWVGPTAQLVETVIMKNIKRAACLVLTVTSAFTNLATADTAKDYSLAETNEYIRDTSYRSLLQVGELTGWWTENIAATMKTAVIPNRLPPLPLPRASHDWSPALDEIRTETYFGDMSLREALDDDRSGLKAFLVIHKGEVVYEVYPNLHPADAHLWASVAKPTAALLIEQLIDEGKVTDTDRVDKYLNDFAGTAMGEVTIGQLLNMVPGTDTHDSAASRKDPDSVATRAYRAEFGEAYNGNVETVREILRGVDRTGPAGEVFEYSSQITQMLVFVAEAITGRSWSDAFDDRVWSHVYAEGALQVHLAPDGMAAAHGIVSSRLRDLARYGLLYTPYWSRVAETQVVSDDAMNRITNPEYDFDVFIKGDGERFVHYLGEPPVAQSRQWDAVWTDGGMFKGGLFGQALYVHPAEGTVIAFYSTVPASPLFRFLRPISHYLSGQ